MSEAYPIINGRAYSFSSIELVWNGKKYKGFRAINYSHTRDVGKAEGSETHPYGNTRGAYAGCEGDMTVLRNTFDAMIADMGDGYMEEQFAVQVSYADKGQPVVTDYLEGITLTEESFNNERGPDATVVERSFTGLWLKPNGVKPVASIPD